MQEIQKILRKIVHERQLEQPAGIQERVLQNSAVQQFLQRHADELNEQIIAQSINNLYLYCLQSAGEDRVMAGYKPQLFLNGNVIDLRYAPTAAKIKNEQERATKRHLELIDLPAQLHEVRLSQVDVVPERAQALTLIRQFLANYEHDVHQRGLYLSGSFGVGKTYLLAGLANAVAAKDKQVIFLHVPTFIANLSSHFNDNSLQTEIAKIAQCDLLILDDIGAETLSQWSRDDVLGVILQARMDNILPTFFSANMALDQLEAHFSATKNALDPVKAARLMERVRFLAKEVIVSGPNRRQ